MIGGGAGRREASFAASRTASDGCRARSSEMNAACSPSAITVVAATATRARGGAMPRAISITAPQPIATTTRRGALRPWSTVGVDADRIGFVVPKALLQPTCDLLWGLHPEQPHALQSGRLDRLHLGRKAPLLVVVAIGCGAVIEIARGIA